MDERRPAPFRGGCAGAFPRGEEAERDAAVFLPQRDYRREDVLQDEGARARASVPLPLVSARPRRALGHRPVRPPVAAPHDRRGDALQEAPRPLRWEFPRGDFRRRRAAAGDGGVLPRDRVQPS